MAESKKAPEVKAPEVKPADAKAPEVKAPELPNAPTPQKRNVVVMNRSSMGYKLRPGPDGKDRFLEVGGTIETLDDKEAHALLDYFGVVDAAKAMPHNEAKINALETEVKRLRSENDALKKANTKE